MTSKQVEIHLTQNQSDINLGNPNQNSTAIRNPFVTIYASLCAGSAKKIYYGVCITICVTVSWVGATHSMKILYYRKSFGLLRGIHVPNDTLVEQKQFKQTDSYDAPFFTTWFCTNWTILYFPMYVIGLYLKSGYSAPSVIVMKSLRRFADKGVTTGRFFVRCIFFCGLWVATNYMYIYSLRILMTTDVMALYATNVACVYLLSWVILHEQFVGVRIVAVILCDTGIALLAYMDGITGSPTLAGVVLAASAAAGSAVYKVLFRKVFGGEVDFSQISLFLSTVGLCNALLLWPVCLGLNFLGVESLIWDKFSWIALTTASTLHLATNLLGNFSSALTYNLFTTLGLITAVPVSAALDIVLYNTRFMGMKLSGMILIATGFFLVLFPSNWPDYFIRLLRWSRRHGHGNSRNMSRDVIDYRTGYIKSHLRSPSGRVR